LAAILLGAGSARAADIEIASPWTRATAKGATVGAGYLTIVNKGQSPDHLQSATTDVAQTVEIHEMSMENTVMTMRAVTGGVEIKPGQRLAFEPGRIHLMLMGLKQPLTQGASIRVTLNFAKAGAIAATFPVEPLGATGPAPPPDDKPPQTSY
jgi:copper(I)-binding protein